MAWGGRVGRIEIWVWLHIICLFHAGVFWLTLFGGRGGGGGRLGVEGFQFGSSGQVWAGLEFEATGTTAPDLNRQP